MQLEENLIQYLKNSMTFTLKTKSINFHLL